MRVNSVRQAGTASVKSVAKNITAPKPNLIVAGDELVKKQDTKVSMGGLIGVCALGISILYGTFKLTDTMFKRF